jgi:tetratricopeptide (TPR) repeat protein/serine/threonine protein kinase
MAIDPEPPMNSVSLELRAIFWEALDYPPGAERQAFLDRACGADDELRSKVEDLLRAHQDAGNFLESPASTPTLTVEGPSLWEAPGSVIGPYKLLEPIGEGGMGTVYRAEQTEPVRRTVALKVIKPGMDTKQVVARFEAERQALAMMDHPNIAKVHDGGATPEGRPYFVMELVRGLPITDYCDRERLSIRDRLELFVLVCRAVQHAHQKGVIHRDLKPSNILVTVIDGVAVPKVIDFGVAKAIGPAVTDSTALTGFHQFIGTPLYMSPEQADLSGVDVDTRSDIYALGVLLYELLTGTTPIESEMLKRAAFDEMRRMIREDEPPRPSTRLGTLGDEKRSSVSAKRHADSRHLGRSLRGELDWIVMKALEKDRRRRYETANGLAADVLRHLTDQPVEACPPSGWYRLRKTIRRNRATLSVLALAVLIFALVAGGAGYVASNDAALRKAVTEALVDADRWGGLGHRAEELEAVKRAEVLLAGGRGGTARVAEVRRRRVALELALRCEAIRLERAAVRDEDFDAALGDRLYSQTFGSIGLDPDAQRPDEAARRLPDGPIRAALVAALDDWSLARRAVRVPDDPRRWARPLAVAAAADPDPWRRAVRAALTSTETGRIKTLKQLQAEAPIDALDPSGAILLQFVILDRNVWTVLREAQRLRPDDFWLAHALARHYQEMKPPDLPEALAYYRAALALRPDSPGVVLNLGTALADAGRHDEAIAAYRRAIALKPDYAKAHNNLGKELMQQGKPEEGIAAYREAIRVQPDHVTAHVNLSRALFERGDLEEAVRVVREALRLRPNDPGALHNLGTILQYAGGDLDEAEQAFREAIRLRPRDPQSYNGLGSLLANRRGRHADAAEQFRRAIEVEPGYALAHENLGRCLLSMHDPAAALAAFDEAVRLAPDDASGHERRAVALAHLGRLDDAIAAARKATELDPGLAAAHHTLGVALGMKADQAEANGPLGGVLSALVGRPREIVAALRRAAALAPHDFDVRYVLGTELLERGDWSGAAAELAEAVRLHPDHPEAHCNLGHALREQGRLDEALAELRRGHELGTKRPGWSYPSAEWVAECEALIREGPPTPARSPVPRE